MTAEALLSRQLLGWPRDFPPLVKGVGMISAHLQESGERNIYYWYYATQLLHNMKGPAWERWNAKIREGLISMQDQGSDLRSRKLGPVPAACPTPGRNRRPALLDFALDPHPRGLLSLPAACIARTTKTKPTRSAR